MDANNLLALVLLASQISWSHSIPIRLMKNWDLAGTFKDRLSFFFSPLILRLMSTKSSAKLLHTSLWLTLSMSSISSTVWSGAKVVKHSVKHVKKGASAIIRPFKHSKHALSNISTSAVSDAEDGPAVNKEQGSVKSYALSEVIKVESDSEELNNPKSLEKQLGLHSFHLFLTISLIFIISSSTENLEVPGLLSLQKRGNNGGTSRPPCSLLCLLCKAMQKFGWRGPMLSR